MVAVVAVAPVVEVSVVEQPVALVVAAATSLQRQEPKQLAELVEVTSLEH